MSGEWENLAILGIRILLPFITLPFFINTMINHFTFCQKVDINGIYCTTREPIITAVTVCNRKVYFLKEHLVILRYEIQLNEEPAV